MSYALCLENKGITQTASVLIIYAHPCITIDFPCEINGCLNNKSYGRRRNSISLSSTLSLTSISILPPEQALSRADRSSGGIDLMCTAFLRFSKLWIK